MQVCRGFIEAESVRANNSPHTPLVLADWSFSGAWSLEFGAFPLGCSFKNSDEP
jgi:hypothetical protein